MAPVPVPGSLSVSEFRTVSGLAASFCASDFLLTRCIGFLMRLAAGNSVSVKSGPATTPAPVAELGPEVFCPIILLQSATTLYKGLLSLADCTLQS